jgi:hypothetical protein
MVIHAQGTSRVAMGFATHVDAFQGGREAAQMAKSQLPTGNTDLVLVFGPAQPRFQELIEGVRLVTGEDKLIGIPTSRIISTNLTHPDSFLVLMVQSPLNQFNIASVESDPDGLLAASTSLISQFRNRRGTVRKHFRHHGFLLFDSIQNKSNLTPSQTIGFEAGLESWILGIKPQMGQGAPLIGRDMTINQGIVGIECLSDFPWGIGDVGLHSFKNQAKILPEAVGAAIRDASQSFEGVDPAFGFIMFNFSLDSLSNKELFEIIERTQKAIPEIPLVGFTTSYQFIRSKGRPTTVNHDSVAVLLAPK